MKMNRYGQRMALVLALIAIMQVAPPVVRAAGDARQQALALIEKGIARSDGSAEEELFYEQAYAADPSYPRPLYNLGLTYMDRKMYEVAITFFERYLEFKPNALEAVYQLGACYDNLHQTGPAIKHYKHYLELTGKSAAKTESLYIKSARSALQRLGGTGAPQSATSGRGDAPMSISRQVHQLDELSVDQMVGVLMRPRMRGGYRLDGPVVTMLVNFVKDSDEYLPGAEAKVEKIAQAINDQRLEKIRIRINGHCSTEGTDEHNKELSVRRAERIRNDLIKKFKVSEERLGIQGFGKTHPLIQPENSEDDRTVNRRVEIENFGQPAITEEGPASELPQ